MNESKRCLATPGWSVEISSQFKVINNPDSWQATADTRTVYLSSMRVSGGSTPSTAANLCADLAKTFAQSPALERLRFAGAAVIGEANLKALEGGFELRGAMCVDGCVATCLINFSEEHHRDWAIATWQSLQPTEHHKPWWKLW